MGRNAARRRQARDHQAVLDGSVTEAVRFGRDNRWLLVEAAMARFPEMKPEAARQLVERLLHPRRRVGLGGRLKSLLVGLVTMAGGLVGARGGAEARK